jgi:hypothetical protein
MNPHDETHRERLFRAIGSSYRALKPFRNLSHGLVTEYVGPGYGQTDKPSRPKYLNLLNQAAVAYVMGLAANRPRVLITTRLPQFKYFAAHFQTGLNNLAEEMILEDRIRRWVLDALFCIGILKIHMADSGQVMMHDGMLFDPGQPAVSNVSIDNFVFDMTATSWDKVKFAGDMYRIPFDDLKSDIYDQEVVKDIQPSTKYLSEGDPRLDHISHGADTDHDELEPMVDLCDQWVPRDGMIYTFQVRDRNNFTLTGKPVAVMEWDGPELGPYPTLGFDDVSENIMPVSKFSHLSMLDRLINNIMRKQARRASSAKRNHIYTATGTDDAKKLQAASDDEWVCVNDVKEIGDHVTGGIDPQSQSFMLGAMELFDRLAGNLTAMLGLGAQAETFGQEQIIQGAVSRQEAEMQARVFDGTRRVFRELGYLLWNDKFKTMQGQMPIEGAEGYVVDMPWTPDDRQGSFFDYSFSIDIFSMGYQSPAARLAALNQLLTQIYLPAMPFIQQQGGVIDWAAISKTHSELMNEPRLKDWIKFAAPIGGGDDESGGFGGDLPMKQANTTRNYVRKSVPTGGTQASRSHVQQQMWMNGGANQGQQAALARPAA